MARKGSMEEPEEVSLLGGMPDFHMRLDLPAVGWGCRLRDRVVRP